MPGGLVDAELPVGLRIVQSAKEDAVAAVVQFQGLTQLRGDDNVLGAVLFESIEQDFSHMVKVSENDMPYSDRKSVV